MRWVGALLLASCADVPLDEPSASWSDLAPLRAPLQENAVVVLDERVVVVGGLDPGSLASARVEAYDPELDRWSALPDLPEGRHHVNAAVVDGTLVALGGLGPAFDARGAGWRLDGDRWTPVAPMPAGRERGAAIVGVLDGEVHLIGGIAGSDVAWHDVWDPIADRWRSLPDAPVARDHGGGAVIDGALCAVGGRHGSIGSHLSDLWTWTEGDGWTERAPMPTSRGGIAVAALRGRLHAIGGEGSPDGPDGVFDTHEAWDPATDSWETLDPPNWPRHGTGAAVVGDRLFLPGGADRQGIGAIDGNEVYDPF